MIEVHIYQDRRGEWRARVEGPLGTVHSPPSKGEKAWINARAAAAMGVLQYEREFDCHAA